MAQTASPLPGEGMPRPLPRGGRPLRSRDTRPRFQLLDAGWMVLLAALFAGFCFAAPGRQAPSVACLITSAATVVLTFLLGWRASGRPAGVIAGLLLATSGTFAAASALSLPQDIAAFLTLAALFAFVAGSSLAALALAAALVWLRPECVLLGLLLLTFTIRQQRKRAWLGAALFLVPAILAAAYLLFGTHSILPQIGLGFHPDLWAWLTAPATLFASWFLLPFCGEMSDPVRRARWLPLILWTALSALLASVLTVGHAPVSAVLAPFSPLWFLLTGAGLARLLPTLTGDLPIPALRYVVATLAVLALVTIRARVEWPLPSRPAALSPIVAQPVTAPASPAPAALAPTAPPDTPPPAAVSPLTVAAPKPTPVPHKPATARHPAPLPGKAKTLPVKPQAAKSAVRLYVVKNGRLVRRSKWAIQWDLTHPHP